VGNNLKPPKITMIVMGIPHPRTNNLSSIVMGIPHPRTNNLSSISYGFCIKKYLVKSDCSVEFILETIKK
jgi:hypothetical protein